MKVLKLPIAGLLCAVVVAAQAAKLPSAKEQIALLEREPFSVEYRLAVGSTQWKPVVARPLAGAGGGLIGGAIDSLWALSERATLKGSYVGKTPLQAFDESMRDLVAAKLPADAVVLDRATYGKPKKPGANLLITAASEPAKAQGFDGLLFVYLTPELRNAPGAGKYFIGFNTHTVVRSIKNSELLVTHLERVSCPSEEPADKDELADAIAECYPAVAERVGQFLTETLDARARVAPAP
jgi:hypothetical protein